MVASVCAADAVEEPSPFELELEASGALFEDPFKNVLEAEAPSVVSSAPMAQKRMSSSWVSQEIDWLRQERDGVRLAGPSLGVGFSILGFAAGAWLLAIGVEGVQDGRDPCSYDGSFCISRPAPYAGTVLMGLSVFGLVRAGQELRQRAQRRRDLQRQIHHLVSH
jgi:hypothetical protein